MSGIQPVQRPSASPSLSFSSIFADKHTRIIFVPIAIGVAVAFSFWLNWIIQSRWIQQRDHPTVVVSSQRLNTIPAVQAVGFQFPSELFDVPLFNQSDEGTSDPLPPSNTLEHFVIPRFDPAYPGASLQCDFIQPRRGSTMCQPIQDGKRIYGNDPNAPLPDLTDPNVWKLQFTRSSESICIDFYSFVHVQPILDAHQTTEFPYYVPFLVVHLMDPLEVVNLNRFVDGVEPFSRDRMMQIISNVEDLSIHEFNSMHSITASLSKSIDVYGVSKLMYNVATREQLRLTPSQVNNTLLNLFKSRPEVEPRVRGYLALPDVKLFVMNLCIHPQSMTVITTTETVLYGIWNFMSDTGGFLSTTTLAFALLFPIINKVVEPRRFVVFLLFSKFMHRNDRHTEPEQEGEKRTNDEESTTIKLPRTQVSQAEAADASAISMHEINSRGNAASDADANTINATL